MTLRAPATLRLEDRYGEPSPICRGVLVVQAPTIHVIRLSCRCNCDTIEDPTISLWRIAPERLVWSGVLTLAMVRVSSRSAVSIVSDTSELHRGDARDG
jgi:hypothetical protein